MKSKAIFSFLRIATNILFYFMVIITPVFIIASVMKMAGNNTLPGMRSNDGYESFEVKPFGGKTADINYNYSTDSLVRYHDVQDRYTVQVASQSAMGYFTMISKIIFMLLGVAVLWNFKRIFKDIDPDDPFKFKMIRRLKIMAALFIISDLLELVHYFIFNNFLHDAIPFPKMQLITNTGNGLITGLIIYVIAIIYERGVMLQEENALTV